MYLSLALVFIGDDYEIYFSQHGCPNCDGAAQHIAKVMKGRNCIFFCHGGCEMSKLTEEHVWLGYNANEDRSLSRYMYPAPSTFLEAKKKLLEWKQEKGISWPEEVEYLRKMLPAGNSG